jgi:hypothetical protein
VGIYDTRQLFTLGARWPATHKFNHTNNQRPIGGPPLFNFNFITLFSFSPSFFFCAFFFGGGGGGGGLKNFLKKKKKKNKKKKQKNKKKKKKTKK